jgi:thiamine pyrophosphokinase
MKSHRVVAIVGNGTLDASMVEPIKTADSIVGVDYAAFWLLVHDIIPDVAIGDFDSVTEEEVAVIRKKVKTVASFPPEKDFTDMELAIEHAAKLHPSEIIIYGGVGSRLDHSVGNILLLSRFVDAPFSVRLVNATNECRVVNKNSTIHKSSRFRYVSLLSLTDESVITLKGFKYEIESQKILRGQTVGISNEITGEKGCITVYAGVVLLIQSRD